ncbi:hypothetical protein Hanom_Chr05g00394701 [Helianthus anomalus]
MCFPRSYLLSNHRFLFQERERGRHVIVNPSFTLPPLRCRAGVTVIVNVSTPTVATTIRDLRV